MPLDGQDSQLVFACSNNILAQLKKMNNLLETLIEEQKKINSQLEEISSNTGGRSGRINLGAPF